METLKPGVPITTREPVVALDPRLPPGTYRVTLVVEGLSGKSAPVSMLIHILRE